MTIKSSQQNLIWKAQKYHDLAVGQFASAMQLISKINIINGCNILGVGCGDGKITAELAKKAKDGSVIGIDPSKEMLLFAKQKFCKKLSNLSFISQKAESLNFSETFDLIFSCFALQWVKEKDNFFRSAHKHLNKHGILALIIPLEISVELNLAIKRIISLPQWKLYFEGFKENWHFESIATIESLVDKNGFLITYSSYEIQDALFSSKEDLESYIKLWFPYLIPLPDFLRNSFFRNIMDSYYEIMSEKFNYNEQEIMIKIPQLVLTAKKAI